MPEEIKISMRVPEVLLKTVDEIGAKQGKDRTKFILDSVRDKLNRMGVKIAPGGGYRHDPHWADGIETSRKRHKRRYHFS